MAGQQCSPALTSLYITLENVLDGVVGGLSDFSEVPSLIMSESAFNKHCVLEDTISEYCADISMYVHQCKH